MKIILLLSAFCLASVTDARKGGRPAVAKPGPEILNPASHVLPAGRSQELSEDLQEGDLLNQEDDQENRNGMSNPDKLWPDARVPYVLDSSLDENMKGLIAEAIQDYNKFTCVRFVEAGDNDWNYVNIGAFRPNACFAYRGRKTGMQLLNLDNWGCADKGTVIHEMLHTIGFGHEQSRNDRDQYITVHYDNIKPKMYNQFKKLDEENNMQFGYDYNSVMHYPQVSFAVDKTARTITTLDPNYQDKIGQRFGFSRQDVDEVNWLYGCAEKKTGKHICQDNWTAAWCILKVAERGLEQVCDPRKSDLRQHCQKTCNYCSYA